MPKPLDATLKDIVGRPPVGAWSPDHALLGCGLPC
jgi:hypothetical protein